LGRWKSDPGVQTGYPRRERAATLPQGQLPIDATTGLSGNGEGDTLWAANSNLRAFFSHDIKTGKMIEKIQLTETDPIIHGATVRDGYMWFCDDVGWIANFKM
jgi:hypothetical protein